MGTQPRIPERNDEDCPYGSRIADFFNEGRWWLVHFSIFFFGAKTLRAGACRFNSTRIGPGSAWAGVART